MDDIVYDKLSSLSEISKAQLAKILRSNSNKKDLTLESSIIKPLEKICGVSWLKTNGIEKIFKLDNNTSSNRENVQFYMIYTNIQTFHKVLQHIQSQIDVNNPETDKFHIICVPKTLYAFEQAIEENVLWNIVKLYSFQWLPIHLDEGILSLEIPDMFKDIFVYENYTLLPTYAKSLWQFFLVFGKPNFTLTLGVHAHTTLKQLNSMLEGTKLEESAFGGLVIIDRNIDYASSLLTPGTYSALLHEIYGITCGVCKEEKSSEVSHIDEQCNKIIQKQPVNLLMDCKKDMIYNLIKDKYFTQVTDILRVVTKDLKVQGQTSEMALEEMKHYVQTKLQSVTQRKQMVAGHLNAAETIVKYLHERLEKLIDVESNILANNSKGKNFTALEEIVQTERDPNSSLALFLLLCITQKVTDSEVKSFLSKYFVEFGFNLGFLYRNLVRGNFFDNVNKFKYQINLPNLTKSNFYTNASKFKQIISEPEKINLKNPSCCSYVFGGTYIPFIAQICNSILCGTSVEDIKLKLQNVSEVYVAGQYQISKKSLLVYVVGGITYSEIAALNLLETLMGVKIIKISDKIISKNDIASAFITL